MKTLCVGGREFVLHRPGACGNARTMRILDGEQLLARIFIGDDRKWHHQPLYRALLERLRREGFAGATVFHGVAGFGAASVIHTAHIVDLSGDLPVVIEVVDDQPHMDRLVPILDEMVTGGALVTIEKVRVLKYASGARISSLPPSSGSDPGGPPGAGR
jgi:hypothetical protein